MLNILAIDLQQAFASIETWVAALIAFLTTTTAGGVIMAIINKVLIKKVNTQTEVSKVQIEAAAKTGAEKAVKTMVGKSFNVNIKAEVDKAVKAELQPISTNAEYAATSARNAEIATAYMLLSQTHSRMVPPEEKERLKQVAEKLLAHANGDVVAPVVIEVAEAPIIGDVVADVEETPPVRNVPQEESADNASLVSLQEIV